MRDDNKKRVQTSQRGFEKSSWHSCKVAILPEKTWNKKLQSASPPNNTRNSTIKPPTVIPTPEVSNRHKNKNQVLILGGIWNFAQ